VETFLFYMLIALAIVLLLYMGEAIVVLFLHIRAYHMQLRESNSQKENDTNHVEQK
jgi:hypothetical protein